MPIPILMSSVSSVQITDSVSIFIFFCNLDFFISLFRVFPCFGFWVFFFFMSFVCAGRFEILFGLHYTTRIMVISPKDLGLWECSRKILSLISYKVF